MCDVTCSEDAVDMHYLQRITQERHSMPRRHDSRRRECWSSLDNINLSREVHYFVNAQASRSPMYEGRVMSIGITAKRMVGSCLRIRIMASCWSVVSRSCI
jgi:hypothetical protein